MKRSQNKDKLAAQKLWKVREKRRREKEGTKKWDKIKITLKSVGRHVKKSAVKINKKFDQATKLSFLAACVNVIIRGTFYKD